MISGCINDDEPKGSEINLNDKLPNFSVTLNNGKTITTQDLSGKKGLIMFFNTNCPDCQREIPVVQDLWEIYKEDADVDIILIAREEGYDEIAEYWKEHDLTVPFSPQENRDVYSLFAKSVIPRIYIFNKESRIIFMSGDEDLPSLNLLVDTIEALN